MNRKPESVRPDLTGADVYRLWQEAYAADNRITEKIHAARLGMPYGIYMGRLWVGKNELEAGKIPTYSLGTPWELEGDYILIGDTHIPFQDNDWLGLVLAVGKKQLKKPRKLLIGGDFFDFSIFSSWAALVRSPGWHEEKAAAQAVMRDLLTAYDEVWMLTGNHERRLTKSTDGEMNAPDICELLSVNVQRVHMSNFAYCELTSGGVKWRISHAKEYSAANPLGKADLLAQKHQCNIVMFHQHALNIGMDKWNKYVVCNGGCLVRQDKLAYCTLEDDARPRFVNGFVLLKNGTAQLFGDPPFTRWEDWL